MSYIPKEHSKYNILPNSRKGNWEVVSYDPDLISEILDLNCGLGFPFQPNTLEEYYNEIDECIKQHPEYANKLRAFKQDLINRNNKDNWSILKYVGETNINFTNGVYYYVPVFQKGNHYYADGIIDDEEFTSYLGWEDTIISTENFIVVSDPHNVLNQLGFNLIGK